MPETLYYNPKINSSAVLVLFNRERILSLHNIGLMTRIGSGNCDICVSGAYISPEHGVISLIDGRYMYMDTGVFASCIKNIKLSKGTPVQLNDGDVICLGSQTEDENAVFALFSESLGTDCVWDEILLENASEISVGRSSQSGVMLEDMTVSENHATFFCRENTWAVADRGSTNGVVLNGRKINAPRYLEIADVISIAKTVFIYTGKKLLFSDSNAHKSFYAEAPGYNGDAGYNGVPAYTETPVCSAAPASTEVPPMPSYDGGSATQLVINIKERSVTKNFKKKYLLQDINISVNAGEMILILGGSGAGKTTFINAVMGYEKAVGRIVYNDTDVYEDYSKMKYEIGFVPQQDLLRGTDTVLNTLANSAEMKLSKNISFEEREKRIEAVLEEMGLSREKNTLVSRLSGGQRKRLSIAVELVADPGLFFLDEPDSGVDDIMGRGLMENLKGIANRGKIVMVITHSPERAADLFDKVIVLAKSAKDNCGYLAFYGSPDEAFGFFDTDSFRGIVKKINRPDENGEGLSDYYIEKYKNYRGDDRI